MSSATVRHLYRELVSFVKHSPQSQSQLKDIRAAFRRPLDGPIEQRIEEAQGKISFLRITMPKTRTRGESGVWLYKDGEKIQAGKGTARDGSRVHSNWDGKNMDPEAVTRHKSQLKRAGFVNNAHAKGLF